MTTNKADIPNNALYSNISPFGSTQEAWFWFMQANAARLAGARFGAGKGDMERPCEPNDIMNVVNRLYRRRRLDPDHLRVLAFYGEKLTPPDPKEPKQLRAYDIWQEAMERLGAALRLKSIVAQGLTV